MGPVSHFSAGPLVCEGLAQCDPPDPGLPCPSGKARREVGVQGQDGHSVILGKSPHVSVASAVTRDTHGEAQDGPGDLSRLEPGWGQGVSAAIGVHLQSWVPLPTQVSRQKAGGGQGWGEPAAASLLRGRQAGGDGPGRSGSGLGPAYFFQPLSTHQWGLSSAPVKREQEVHCGSLLPAN